MTARRIVVGVSGSIACYKAADVVRGLVKSGHEVRVVMTRSAQRFVGEATFAALSGNPVVTDVFDQPHRVMHVELARQADVFVVVGATASTLARLATGSGADALAATFLMCRCPIVIAPAMHTEMWEHPAVQSNVALLASRGAQFCGPATGDLASGDVGVGRLADPSDIVGFVQSALAPRDLAGLRFLITAGPTREKIDPVRFISNRSSGRMGYALAATATSRGAHVTLVTGPTALARPRVDEVVEVETAAEMYDACVARFDKSDVTIKVAAVADFTPGSPSDGKLPKGELGSRLDLIATADIAAALGEVKRPDQTLVVFAAQSSEPELRGAAKLDSKKADLVVANLVARAGTGFDTDTNDAFLIDSSGTTELPRMSKLTLAEVILDRIVALRRRKSPYT